jgi:hypothetical protein
MITRLVFACALLVSLAACGSMEEGFGIADPFAVPKPFDETNLTAVPVKARPQPIAIYPVVGLKPAEATNLQRAILNSSNDSDVLAVEPGVGRRMALRGLLRLEKENSTFDLIHVRWFIVDPDGKELGSFDVATTSLHQESEGVLTSETAKAVAARTIEGLQSLLSGEDSSAALTSSTMPHAPQPELLVYVAKPQGAPGDGNEALQRALAAILDADPNVTVVASPDKARVLIDGQIRLQRREGVDIADKIELAWRVTAPDGAELGTVAQANDVPSGSLDSRWGDTALSAAQAAAGGIIDLFAQLQMAPE